MIINKKELVSTNDKREDCLRIIEAGMSAANPALFMHLYLSHDKIKPSNGNGGNGNDIIHLDKYSEIHTVAFGKAADTMTSAVNTILKDRLTSGIIIMPKHIKSASKSKKFRIFNAKHPTPDKTSVKAAKETIKFLQARRDGELVIFLISGGGSSLLALPKDVTLGEKIHVTNLLLKSGATIQEFNCVRKCLSKVKGGKLARYLKCDGVGLLMSDVQGRDDLSSIASGPTISTNHIKEHTQYQDALDILTKYNLVKKVGDVVINVLYKNAQLPTTNKTSKSVTQTQDTTVSAKSICNPQTHTNRMIGNYIIAKNSDCTNKMIETAKSLGYSISDMSPIQVVGDIKEAADVIYRAIPQNKHNCLVFGGETTVKILGNGKGGRNQELVLRLLKKSQNTKYNQKRLNVTFASVGTDGIDGNSIYAGAISDNEYVDLNLINTAIKNSDSSGFFEKRRKNKDGKIIPPSLIRTGPTHTNLTDIGVILT